MYLDQKLRLIRFQILANQSADSIVVILRITLVSITKIREQVDGIADRLVRLLIGKLYSAFRTVQLLWCCRAAAVAVMFVPVVVVGTIEQFIELCLDAFFHFCGSQSLRISKGKGEPHFIAVYLQCLFGVVIADSDFPKIVLSV
ncbi:hypothetical protein [Robinsoniella peoriensis]|uniref:hypothetical protein n=1 Tax=Robinsoniella peoriensis TaxID=180332 RepID=UPI00366ACD9F